MCRISSVELMIRNETERVLRESREEGPKCVCGKKGVKVGLCRNCLMRDVTDRLRKAGHDSGMCKSKWRRTPDIPSGTDVLRTLLYVSDILIRVGVIFYFHRARVAHQLFSSH